MFIHDLLDDLNNRDINVAIVTLDTICLDSVTSNDPFKWAISVKRRGAVANTYIKLVGDTFVIDSIQFKHWKIYRWYNVKIHLGTDHSSIVDKAVEILNLPKVSFKLHLN